MKQMTPRMIGPAAVFGLAMMATATASAGVFTYTDGSTTFTVVEADPFAAGGSPGNTVQISDPTQPFDSLAASTTLWHFRNFSTLDHDADGNTTEPFVHEAAPTAEANVPQLRTTLTGLPALSGGETYAVYVVYLGDRQTGAGRDGSEGTILADIQTTTQTSATSVRWINDPFTVRTGRLQGTTYEMVMTPIGLVSGSSFSVLIGADASDFGLRGTQSRSDYIGLAYTVVPEPGVMALGLAGLALLAGRRRTA